MFNILIEKALNFTKEHSPEILIGAGVVGMATSSVLAVRATPRALELMEDKKAELGVTYLTRKEVAQTTWKQYIPAIGLGVVSASCIILGTSQNMRRNTALATVYALSESTLREYEVKTKELVGEEKAKEIDTEVNKSVALKRQVQTNTIIENRDSGYVAHTGNGDTLIYDSLSGRFFRSSVNAVERAVNSVNHSLNNEYIMTMNDLYNEMDVPTVGVGSLLGWKSDKESIEITFDSDVDKLGNPFLILSYINKPVPLYNGNYNY